MFADARADRAELTEVMREKRGAPNPFRSSMRVGVMAALAVMLATVSNDYKRLLIGLLQDIMCFMVQKGALCTAMKRNLTSPPSFVPRNMPTIIWGIWDFFPHSLLYLSII